MISKIKWKNHSVLGNLELDFTKDNGKIYNTIILAGENGTGKTTILDTISEFLNLGAVTPFDYIEYKIEDDDFRIYYGDQDNHKLGFHQRESLKTGEKKGIYSNKNNDRETINNDLDDIRHYGIAYSKARSGFKTNSEYVIKSALQNSRDALIIVLKEKENFIAPVKITAPSVLPTITSAETNYLAFNIVSIDYHIQLYGYLQAKTQKHKIKECDNYIKNHPSYDSNKYGKMSQYGNTQYETLCTYIRNAIDHPDSGNTYTKEELRTSIEFLIELCKENDT